ncbi:hypothetical protein ES703_29404 [subsurface metagenome]
MIKSLWPRYTQTEKIAAAQFLAEKGDLSASGQLTEKGIKKIVKTANIFGAADPILTNRPDLAPEVGKTHKEIFDKTKVAATEKFQVEAFRNKPGVQRAFLENTNTGAGHLGKIATTNTEVMNELQKFIHGLGTNAPQRRAQMQGINAKLVNYIDSNAGQGLGWTFGTEEEKPKSTPKPTLVSGTEKEFKETRKEYPRPEEKPFG